MAERLRRSPAKRMCNALVGSNPAGIDEIYIIFFVSIGLNITSGILFMFNKSWYSKSFIINKIARHNKSLRKTMTVKSNITYTSRCVVDINNVRCINNYSMKSK